MKPPGIPWGAALLLLAWARPAAAADDWPTYRADAARSGWTREPLPERLELRWVFPSGPPRPAWPSSSRISYDYAHQPVVLGGTVVFGSTIDDSVVALDLETGARRWRFFTGAPVRFAPAGWRDRVFAASDDGWLYALALADGRVLWKHRGGPSDRRVLGNGRLVSRWPARGGPVVVGDAVFYAAGIWPSEGVYLHALEAKTGRPRWTNDRTGPLVMGQPHRGAVAASGVSPQGYLAAAGDVLLVPTGRAVPAGFNLSDGELRHYRLQENGAMGGSRVLVAGRYAVNGGCFLEAETGVLAARAGRGVFGATPDGVLQFTGSQLLRYRWGDVESRRRDGTVARTHGLVKTATVDVAPEPEEARRAAEAAAQWPALRPLFRTDIVFKEADPNVSRQTGLERTLAQSRPDIERLGARLEPFLATEYERFAEVIAAGDEAVCGAAGRVSIVDRTSSRVRWTRPVEGAAVGLAAAGGALLVSTTAGRIYCFGAPRAPREERADGTGETPAPDPAAAEAAEEILRVGGVREGFCLDVDCGEGQLALELVRRSALYVVGLEGDPGKAARARDRLARAGVYGARACILEGKLSDGELPRHFADLIVSSARLDPPGAPEIPSRQIGELQRPEGGVACLGARGRLRARRRGPLEGAGSWTHQNADASNTLCSGDARLRGPLEISWYHDGVPGLPDRHAQTPAPLYDRGILVVEGVHGISGIDAYNGRVRWTFPVPGLLSDWNGVHHDVGVGDVGGNMCLGDSAVFVRHGPNCLKLDLITGRKLAEFRAPAEEGSANRHWGYLAYDDGTLYGTVLDDAHTVSPRYDRIRLRTESVSLFALDAGSGAPKWIHKAERSLRNNAIAVAGGRVFLIDREPAPQDRIAAPRPDGKPGPLLKPGQHPGGVLMALEGRTGAVLWRSAEDIFGTQLAAAGPSGPVLMYYQAVKHNFFRLPSEIGGRLAAFDARDGRRLWDRAATYRTRPLVVGDTIYAEGGAWELGTGKDVPWEFERSYGCGQIASGRHLMVFRSATLGYRDLSPGAEVKNFGAVRPGCWISAIPAGGRVLAPDGSFQCACSYQMQAWLALQPVKEPDGP